MSADDGDGASRAWPSVRVLALALLAPPLTALAVDRVLRPAARVAYIWARLVPILLSYVVTCLALAARAAPEAEREAARRALHAANAPRVLALINDVKGGYVKVGQVFSNRRDVLPDAYTAALATLQNDAAPRPWPTVRATIERELRKCADGPSLRDAFESIETAPIGVASVAQVHRATLAATGESVVVKVQHAGARRLFAADLRNIELLAKLVIPPLAPVVSEIRGRFATEFDFKREAESLAAVGASMRARFGGRIVVPRPLGRLSTARMLVMDFVPGPTLAARLERETLRAVGARNFARLAARARGDDAGAAALPAASAGDRLRLALAVPSLWRLRRGVGAQLRLLARAHGAQILLDGKFNGDPHSGNVLVVPGRARALGLIDFGQVRDLSSAQRRALGRLVLALADRRASDATIARAFRELGFRSKRGSDELAARIARIMFDADDHSASPAAVLRSLAALDSIEQFPLEFVMAARVSLILRGLGLAFGVRLRTAELWRPYARECLQEPPPRALIG